MLLSNADGFVRMRLDVVLKLSLRHLLSGLDADASNASRRCGTAAAISGFTEWVSPGGPGVSIGWDWRFDGYRLSMVRMGFPRSNLLLVDDVGNDYAWQRNLEILGTVVDAIPWIARTQRALNTTRL